ncbi:hypothetical protein VPH35_079960 [Triticum aestivum]|uniref:Pre-mRNA-processing factor 6 n=1 Tax=Aegilops tauschii TaxID=37682 RepID=M8CNC4_AEGTA
MTDLVSSPPPPAAAPACPVRHDILNSKLPANYVVGLGRGATGFTTRSDVGPTAAAAVPAVGRGCGNPLTEDEGGDEDKGYDENQKFDEFEGNDAGLFSNADHDDDDREADAVWDTIDQRMDLRRKGRRDARLKREIEKWRLRSTVPPTLRSPSSLLISRGN